MRRRILLLILFVAVFFGVRAYFAKNEPSKSPEVYFSPNGGAEQAVVEEIRAAHKSILIQAYSFTNPSIGEALLSAHRRGVRVEAVLDRENLGNPHSLMIGLAAAGVSCYLDGQHAIAHNKLMVIDDGVVITGSFNFTKAAESKNAENLLILRDKVLVNKYEANWKIHRAHSSEYVPE